MKRKSEEWILSGSAVPEVVFCVTVLQESCRALPHGLATPGASRHCIHPAVFRIKSQPRLWFHPSQAIIFPVPVVRTLNFSYLDADRYLKSSMFQRETFIHNGLSSRLSYVTPSRARTWHEHAYLGTYPFWDGGLTASSCSLSPWCG